MGVVTAATAAAAVIMRTLVDWCATVAVVRNCRALDGPAGIIGCVVAVITHIALKHLTQQPQQTQCEQHRSLPAACPHYVQTASLVSNVKPSVDTGKTAMSAAASSAVSNSYA